MGSTASTVVFLNKIKTVDLKGPPQSASQTGIFLYEPNEREKRTKVSWDKGLGKNTTLKHVVENIKENKYHKGFPQAFRWETWKYLLKVSSDYEAYIDIPTASKFSSDIRKDIDRTFPQHPYFNTQVFGHYGQNALKRILEKFAYKWQGVGYCQGMNFIVGFLLLVSGGSEVEVFFLLENFFLKFNLIEFFAEDMKGIKEHLWVFEKLFEEKMNKLYWHFKDQDVIEDMWVLKMFLTLFTINFQVGFTVFIWDLLILEGFESIYRAIFAILKQNQEKLMKMSVFEILNFFNSANIINCSAQSFLKQIRRIKINKGKIQERECKSLPCPVIRHIANDERGDKSDSSSPKVTMQLVTEDPPVLIQRSKGSHNSGIWQTANPFGVNDSESCGESALNDSFNAEDVLNNLVTETDWDSMYI